MIKETYIKRDTGETIKIDMEDNVLFIGNNKYTFEGVKKRRIKRLYDYDKEIFKEFIENINIKYDFIIIDFLINNKITLEEIKEITKIILFCIQFNSDIILSDYNINIIDFFKYIYSQPYEYIGYRSYYDYFYYLKRNKEKINKYNAFPHNLHLAYDILKSNKIKRNNNKDIIKDINNFHIEFYGSKCEYYITYEGKKYDLLNDEDRRKMLFLKTSSQNIYYLSEYYKNDFLYDIIISFENKEYYTKTIKKNIFYLLKDNYKNMNKKEIDKIQKFILKNNNYLFPIKNGLFTNSFKENLYIIDYLASSNLKRNVKEILKSKYFYNNKYKKILDIHFDYNLNFNKMNTRNEAISREDIIIKKIDILDFINLINEREYLNISIEDVFRYIFNDNLYLCTDKETKEKIFIYKDFQNLSFKYEIKTLNKEYNEDFLKRIKKIKI